MKKFILLPLLLVGTFVFGQRVYFSSEPILSDATSFQINLTEKDFITPQLLSPKQTLGPYIAAKTSLLNINESNLDWQYSNQKATAKIELNVRDASTLNILLENLSAPESTLLYLISDSQNFGPYTTKNFDNNSFSHFPIEDSSLKLQFEVNKSDINNLKFTLTNLNASFENAFKDGSCNIPSICPEAGAYRKAQKSTVIISTNGVGFCTGTLMNNSTGDGTPYILTAQHCLPPSNNVSNWSFAFNFEAQNCNTPDINNGKSFSLRGADVVAQNGNSDFALLKIREDIQATDSVFFAGWDKTDESPEQQFVFHHPNGALKRFSLNQNLVERTTYLENNAPPFVWKVDKWEQGTTEGGSSGSALMSPSGLVIGTLVGGEASCSVINGSDFFGRIATGFVRNNDDSKSLSPWLNPSNTLLDSLKGMPYPREDEVPNVDLVISKISGFEVTSCDGKISPKVKVKNIGSSVVSSYSLFISNPSTSPWASTTPTQALSPGQELEFVFPERTYEGGFHNFDIVIIVDNDATPENNSGQINTEVLDNTVPLQMQVTTDDFGSENSWVILDANNNAVAFGGPYSDGENGVQNIQDFCLSKGCYTLEFTDSYGDGMCCDFGEGFFNLTDGAGTVLVSGYSGPTNNTETSVKQETYFCIGGATSVTEIDDKNLNIYPNPIQRSKLITIEGISENIEVKTLSIDGKLINVQSAINLKAPNSPGIYFLNVDGHKVKQIVVY